MIPFVLALILSCSSLPSFAQGGNSAGNGGDGYLVNGKLYLFDLYEHGLHLTGSLNPNAEILSEFQENLRATPLTLALNQALGGTESERILNLLAAKLSDIARKHYSLAVYLTSSFRFYNFTFGPITLQDILDEGDDPNDSVIQFDRKNIRQLAVRKNYSIKIDSMNWALIDDLNRVALLIHEMVYALNAPAQTKLFAEVDANGNPIFQQGMGQVSLHARDIIGVLFDPAFEFQMVDALKNALVGKNTLDQALEFDERGIRSTFYRGVAQTTQVRLTLTRRYQQTTNGMSRTQEDSILSSWMDLSQYSSMKALARAFLDQNQSELTRLVSLQGNENDSIKIEFDYASLNRGAHGLSISRRRDEIDSFNIGDNGQIYGQLNSILPLGGKKKAVDPDAIAELYEKLFLYRGRK